MIQWHKVDGHPFSESAYEGEIDGHTATFWLWKEDNHWRVSCSALNVVGENLTRGATEDQEAQKQAVRFFALTAMSRAGIFQALWAALAGGL